MYNSFTSFYNSNSSCPCRFLFQTNQFCTVYYTTYITWGQIMLEERIQKHGEEELVEIYFYRSHSWLLRNKLLWIMKFSRVDSVVINWERVKSSHFGDEYNRRILPILRILCFSSLHFFSLSNQNGNLDWYSSPPLLRSRIQLKPFRIPETQCVIDGWCENPRCEKSSQNTSGENDTQINKLEKRTRIRIHSD